MMTILWMSMDQAKTPDQIPRDRPESMMKFSKIKSVNKVSRGPKHQVEYIPEPSEYWIAETNSKGASCLDTKVQVLRFAQNPEKEIQ